MHIRESIALPLWRMDWRGPTVGRNPGKEAAQTPSAGGLD